MKAWHVHVHGRSYFRFLSLGWCFHVSDTTPLAHEMLGFERALSPWGLVSSDYGPDRSRHHQSMQGDFHGSAALKAAGIEQQKSSGMLLDVILQSAKC